jgi:hypothetical protein
VPQHRSRVSCDPIHCQSDRTIARRRNASHASRLIEFSCLAPHSTVPEQSLGNPGLRVDKSERWINARSAQAWTGFGPRHSHESRLDAASVSHVTMHMRLCGQHRSHGLGSSSIQGSDRCGWPKCCMPLCSIMQPCGFVEHCWHLLPALSRV